MSRKGRPDFIPRELFRQHLTTTQINKYLSIDGIYASSFISRCERLGRPIPNIEKRYRMLDIVARAQAMSLAVTLPLEKKVALDLEEAKRELAAVQKKLSEEKHILEMAKLSESLTQKALLTEEEIVAGRQPLEGQCGVYFLIKDSRVVYVGQSINVMARIGAHMKDKDFDNFAFIQAERYQLNMIESLYIHTLRPPLNGFYAKGGSKSAPMSMPDLINMVSAKPHPASGGLDG